MRDRAVAATSRTEEAIRRADQLSRNQVDKLPGNSSPPSNANGGTTIKWAEVSAVTDANNYTCDIWTSRSSYAASESAEESNKQVRVPTIVDQLSVGDNFGVEATTLSGEDYIATQQLGAVG
jgi:hypothetical protein